MNKQEQEQNLRWARTAVKHVKTTCVIGASNRQDDEERTGGWSSACVSRMRGESGSGAATTWGALVRELAQDARNSRCGNCGEQAALAYEFLRTTLNATPIEYVMLDSKRKDGGGVGVCDGDHVFVVIGRKTGDPIGSDTAGVEVQKWNPETVICDPWANEVYQAFDLGVKAVCGGGWHGLRSVCRA